jgi:hypothetical protein
VIFFIGSRKTEMKPKWEDKIIDGGRKMIRLPFCYKKNHLKHGRNKSKIGKKCIFSFVRNQRQNKRQK